MKSEIRSYWEERAREARSDSRTTDDIHMRELEVLECVDTLRRLGVVEGRILDVGCGDGRSTVAIAEAIPTLIVEGIDFSEGMVDHARARATQAQVQDRVSFSVGDVTDLGSSVDSRPYRAALSMRCLINLESAGHQRRALANIAGIVEPGGYYVAIENFHEGHVEMNNARLAVGLPEIPLRWHNRFLTEELFLDWAREHFETIDLDNFASSYYFATRVIYAKMCMMRNEEPDYRHEIHQLAVRLPRNGNFSPIRKAVLRTPCSLGGE